MELFVEFGESGASGTWAAVLFQASADKGRVLPSIYKISSHKQGGNDPQDEHRQDRDATYHREESRRELCPLFLFDRTRHVDPGRGRKNWVFDPEARGDARNHHGEEHGVAAIPVLQSEAVGVSDSDVCGQPVHLVKTIHLFIVKFDI